MQEVASSILASPHSFCTLLEPFLSASYTSAQHESGAVREENLLGSLPHTCQKKDFTTNVREKYLVRTGTRTQNLLLRRQAPYPLGHTDIDEMSLDPTAHCTCHSSLGVEHPLSKRKVVGSNPACGSPISFLGLVQLVFCLHAREDMPRPISLFLNRLC